MGYSVAYAFVCIGLALLEQQSVSKYQTFGSDLTQHVGVLKEMNNPLIRKTVILGAVEKEEPILSGVFCGTIDDPPDNTAALIETSTYLNCTVTTPNNDIEWLHTVDGTNIRIYTVNTGVELPEDYDVHVHGSGSYDLEVKSVRQALSGTYTCKLLFSAVAADAELVALRDLTCTPEEGTQELEEGQLAGLVCETEVFGYKKPKLEWFSVTHGRIENQYTDETPKDEEIEEEDHIVRQIANFTVSPEHNEMRFECRLSFEKEEESEPEPPTYTDSCGTFFYVLHPPQNIEIYPPPESFPDNVIEVRFGDWINCSASARPDPMYEWKDRDDTEYYYGQNLEIVEEMYPPEGESPEKDYRCIVTNEINGQPQVLEREFKFRIDGSPPDDQEPSGTEGWVIAVAILVPVIIIGLAVAAVFFYLYNKKKKNPTSGKYSASSAQSHVTQNPTYATSQRPTSSSSAGPPAGVNPGYTNGGSTGDVPKAGRDSPGYGDLGIKHIGYPVYPGVNGNSAASSQQNISSNPAGRSSYPNAGYSYTNQARRGSTASSTSSAV